MTLTESLLPKLSEWKPAGDGRHSLAVAAPEAGWTVHLTADKADSLSCLVWELTLDRAGDAPEGSTLRAWAEGVAKRATGLLEPLRVIEVDAPRAEALLRSDAPARKGGLLAYYEVRLFGTGRATVRRFAANRTESGREQVAYALTHEVLAKLAGDIAG
ncbi:MAG: hypothetical protein J0I06_26590 [Planctomycetes bacterium]|nr:hypothetical protein [Planctomycetota bacterium]